MLEEGVVHGDSLIHRLDPRVRTVVAGAFSIVVATSDRFVALVPALIIAFSFLLLARLSFRDVIPRLLVVNGLILLLWFFLPFTTDGETLFIIGPLKGTKEGIIYSTAITIKSNTIIMTLMALIGTMPIFTLGRAMGSLHTPVKIVQLISFAYRYIHVIHGEYGRLVNAIKIRGFNPGNNLHTYRTYAYLVGMLLVKSYERARRVQAAMLCRGFRGEFYDLSEFFMKPSDRLALVLLLFVTMCIGVLQWTDIIL
ncbi:MAG: cobalt ECF transporter T component CbiQ [Desulfobacteraceae bacterium]|jgi:cobalt/nickel transport system permease protein